MQIPGLEELLRKNKLFGAISADELKAIAARFDLRVFQLGDIVIRQGDEEDGFYVIYSGKARVVDESTPGNPITVAVLGPGDSFGERALLRRSQRSHTVRAGGDLTVLRLSAADFNGLVAAWPRLLELLEARIHHDAEFSFLRSLGLLSHLTLAQTEDLQRGVETIRLENGSSLFRQGDAGHQCFIVREGRIRILKEFDGRETQVAVVKPGELIGEMSLLHDESRSASAVADGPAVLLGLSRELFGQFLGVEATQQMLVQLAADRLMQNDLLAEGTADETEQADELKISRVRLRIGPRARSWPFVKALRPALSGPACLMMIDAYHGHRHAPPGNEEVNSKLQEASSDTMLTLNWKAEHRGYLARPLNLDKGKLSSASFPAIAEIERGMWGVIYSASAHSVVLADPRKGVRIVPRGEFDELWNGQILTLARVPVLVERGQLAAGSIFRQMKPFLRPFAPLLVAVLAVSLVIQLFGLAQPLFSQVIVDKVLVSGDTALLHLLLLGMLMVTAFQLAATSLRDYMVAHIMRRISLTMQLRFFHHILSLAQKVFSKWRVGDFLIRFQQNERLLQLVSQSAFKVIIDSAMAATYVVILFTMNASLAAVTVPFVAGIVLVLLISSPMMRNAERRVFAQKQAAESHVIEAASGIQTVKSLAIEKPFFERGFGLIGDLKATEFAFGNLAFTSGLISKVLNDGSTVVILGYGATLAISGKITTGELIAFQALFVATMKPLNSLVKLWDEFQEMRVAFERTADVLRAETESEPEDAVAPAITGRVEFQNVGFRYEDEQESVLAGIDLEVLPGQKIALVGRSGSGKTTLVSLLLNLYEPTEGRILIDNADIKGIQKTALRRQLGVVEQSPFLFSGTIRENIAKADPGASLERVIAAATLAGAHQFIEQLPLGYDTQIGERGMTLSGGQKQRLVIARAILGNPKMLILDEATSALDTESESIVQRNLDSVMADRTVFVIAHRLSTIRNADLIVVLDKGAIAEKGTHAELMARRGLYCYLNQAAA